MLVPLRQAIMALEFSQIRFAYKWLKSIKTTKTTLNTKIIKHNLLNGKVYNEQQAIMNLDNAIAVEMEEQGFLLEKLSKLKELSVKQQELLLKTNQDK